MKIRHIGLAVAAVLTVAGLAVATRTAEAGDPALAATAVCEPMSGAYGVNDAGTVAGSVGT